jgi:hypothetical protein
MKEPRPGWQLDELEPPAPISETCFAALLHGEKHQYFLYACVLGRRLRDSSSGPDRVLLCGPGFGDDSQKREILKVAGWSHLLPVEPIDAAHLDKTCAKRHALVFTKLRVLEIPYLKVLLLDVDMLPRQNVHLGELFEVAAPAAKFHCSLYDGPLPGHSELIPESLTQLPMWSPNAGVMRLDPKATMQQRCEQTAEMVEEVMMRDWPSYLPEQYYLSEKLDAWRHIDMCWNWEVWPEWDDPGITHPLPDACMRARTCGWAGYFFRGGAQTVPSASDVLRDVKIWHFSGSWDTPPWMLQNLPDAQAVLDTAASLFRERDPGGIVATGLYEWRLALDAFMTEVAESENANVLYEASSALATEAVVSRERCWTCEGCGEPSRRVRQLSDLPWGGKYCSGEWNDMRWACADCVVARLRSADFQDCACSNWDETESISELKTT